MPASFLGELIKNYRKSEEKDIEKFSKLVTTVIQSLDEADNLRVHDENTGGVLGPRQSRKTGPNTGNSLCDATQFERGGLEVPYFRALFNLPDRELNVGKQKVKLLSYEAPLTRRWKKRGANVKCDLVGLIGTSKVLCIEGKVNPEGDVTDIVYGILESYAYGLCVDYLLTHRRDEFKSEIKSCMKHRHNAEVDLESSLAASYALAAPKEYFQAYFDPTMMKSNSSKKVDDAGRLLEALSKEKPAWHGFLVVSQPCQKDQFERKEVGTIKGTLHVEPHFRQNQISIERVDDLQALRKKFAQH